GGRNFESFGEDPYLASRIAVDYIKGVQQENVAATVKHFAANNQEHQRDHVNTIVDERSLNEIYFPAFKAAVEEGKVLAVMSAYNKLNGPFCSESDYLLVDKLKNEWKFNGLVMSDWGAVHSSIPTFSSGLDLEMPKGDYLNQNTLLDKIKSGELDIEKLDDKVRRILRVMFTIGLFDDYKYDSTKVNTAEHVKIALDVAKEGIVLLKNEGSILPIDISKLKSIAVIGPNSKAARSGGGSSMVDPVNPISPLEALQNKVGSKVKINFAQGLMIDGDSEPIKSKFLFTDKSGKHHGLKGEYFTNKNLEGTPAHIITDKLIDFSLDWKSPFENFPSDNFSIRWTGYLKAEKTDKYTIDVSSDDGVRLYLEDKLVIDDWNDHAVLTNSYTTKLEAGKYYKIKLEYYENAGGAIVKLGWRMPNEKLLTQAINAAKNSDIAIVFAGTSANYESEGFDRKDLILPKEQDQFIKEIVKANHNTIVVLTTGSPVFMNDWINDVPGIIEAWFPGEQAGNAIAEVLLGETNPSGKLPITFPHRWEDCSAFSTYMKEDGTTRYEDGIYVGYRHFEKNKIAPLFPFGYGLSYTQFEYSGLKLSSKEMQDNDKLEVSFTIKNIGKVAGAEVAQLYIQDVQASVDRPVKELKRFSKVHLQPGESKIIKFEIDKTALSFYNVERKSWVAEPGDFHLLIGSSSEDIRLTSPFKFE
ncbi:MAG: glycoside hydrolase family 3 C-terminal domain-containing protein, partial [Ignavibacteriaceae bacterium]|nr:glycoside hydrolase family 3 C-terminal domain-containing protein [Ignavibacteriaceae bacterium]